MPRRPVRPEDRQRVARACDTCKSSKKRCNGNQPCDTCIKKGHVESCHFTPGRRQHHSLASGRASISQRSQTGPSHSDPTRTLTNEAVSLPSPSWGIGSASALSPGSIGADDADADAFGHDESEDSFDIEMRSDPSEGLGSRQSCCRV